ncbi:ureidoglycolate lyase [Arsenicitalea aurantiaca]|uniref:Ureidoglycolate lyase n=1 Tax=Arsenicitalea aurantiaca TaxID=1783274 RepID=A0A433XLG0_9HYPH|nr:ureidoglycolate lyase [Arsenicitalea aurantiaca]RUT34919.1 ureidoglycolate lyase [Arsenicitalea aurantiaca]
MTGERQILVETLTATDFAPFGQVIEKAGAHHYTINKGMTERYHDLATVELGGENPRPLISIFVGQPYRLPLTLTMMERHPLGSQAFCPLGPDPFLVIVAPDEGGEPGRPRAFLTSAGQGVNIGRNVWHGVLTPLDNAAEFLVVDRGGDGRNLEEHDFATPFEVVISP